jgi:mono/diheme cytochrome c family protein
MPRRIGMGLVGPTERLFITAWPVIAVIVVFSATPIAAPQESAAGSPKTVWNGVYTGPQAKRGQTVYEAHCSSCHQADLSGYNGILKGERFMTGYREASVFRLFDKTKSTMPRGAPGSLPDQAYVDIAAYVLKSNGFPEGTEELSMQSMPGILVTVKTGPEPPPNFSLVQTVGCLVQRDSEWVLIHGAHPSRSGHPRPSPEEPLADADRPLGGTTFSLIVSAAFDLSPSLGKKVEARGFLIRRPAESRINVTSLEPIGPSCQQE